MSELIRGYQLSKKSGRKIIVSAVLGTIIGCGGLACAMQSAWAAESRLSLKDVLATTAPSKEAPSASVENNGSGQGIDLEGIPSLTMSAEDQLLLEKQAEEAAALAAQKQRELDEEHNRDSFRQASEGLLPLSPDQIRSFMDKLESTEKAALAPSRGMPKGEIKVATVSLDPSGEPPQINLSPGFVTTIDIIDQTGEPWPIADIGIGGNFEVTPTEAGSHVVRVVPLTRVARGNLSILLKGLSTPIIFRLSSGGETFHMRYDARIPQIGPMAKTPLIQYRSTGPVAGEAVISMILENAPPQEAKRLKIAGLDSRTMAWNLGGKVYVRTPLSLLSPAWNASASSADGMTVYEIGNAPILLMSDNGAMVRARLMREE